MVAQAARWRCVVAAARCLKVRVQTGGRLHFCILPGNTCIMLAAVPGLLRRHISKYACFSILTRRGLCVSSDLETVVTPTQSVVAAALQAAWLQTQPTLGLDISSSSTGVALLDVQGDTRSLPHVHMYTCARTHNKYNPQYCWASGLDPTGQVVHTQAVQRPKDASLLGMAEAVGQQVRHACSLGGHNTPDIAIEECVRSFRCANAKRQHKNTHAHTATLFCCSRTSSRHPPCANV